MEISVFQPWEEVSTTGHDIAARSTSCKIWAEIRLEKGWRNCCRSTASSVVQSHFPWTQDTAPPAIEECWSADSLYVAPQRKSAYIIYKYIEIIFW